MFSEAYMMSCVSEYLISHLFDGFVVVVLDLGWMNRRASRR